MDWISGISQCSALGKTCALNWSAVSAAVSLIGVAVSAVAAAAVFKLGKETNRLADSNRVLAQEDREREAKFILMAINPDVKAAVSNVRGFLGNYVEHTEVFAACDPLKSSMFSALGNIDLHLDPVYMSRLHVLEGKDGVAIVHARAQLKLARLAFSTLSFYRMGPEEKRRVFAVMQRRILASEPDLEHLLRVSNALLRD